MVWGRGGGATHLYLQLSMALRLLHRRKHTDQGNKGEWEKNGQERRQRSMWLQISGIFCSWDGSEKALGGTVAADAYFFPLTLDLF